MSEIDAARQSVRGSLLLLFGNVTSMIISTITIVIIARFLGPEQYGIYTLALAPVSIFLLLGGWGVNTSITRDSAFHISRGEIDIAQTRNAHAIEFLFLLGTLLSLIGYFSAGFISNSILHRPGEVKYIQIAAFSIFGQFILNSSVASFVGWSSAGYASISNIVQSVLKIVSAIFLLILGFGLFGAVLANTASYIVASLFAISILYKLKLHRTGASQKKGRPTFKSDIKSQISFGLPSELGSNISGFASAGFIIILLSMFASNTIIGWYQAATNITIAITLVTTAVTFALFPAFSSLQGRSGDTKLAFKYAVKYTSFFVAPIILFVASSSKQLVVLLYGTSYDLSSNYLTLLALGFLAILVGLTTFAPFFNAVGETRFTLWINLSAVVTILFSAPILGNSLGSYGLIYAIIASDIVTCLTGLFLAKRYLSATIDYLSSLRILISATIGAVFVYILSITLPLSTIPLLVIDVFAFLGVYLTVCPIIGTVDSSDIDRLRSALRDSKFVSKVLNFIFRYEEMLIQLTRRNSKPTPESLAAH